MAEQEHYGVGPRSQNLAFEEDLEAASDISAVHSKMLKLEEIEAYMEKKNFKSEDIKSLEKPLA